MAGVSEVTSCRWAFNESTDINISKEGRWREPTIEIVNINIKKQLLIFIDSLHWESIKILMLSREWITPFPFLSYDIKHWFLFFLFLLLGRNSC